MAAHATCRYNALDPISGAAHVPARRQCPVLAADRDRRRLRRRRRLDVVDRRVPAPVLAVEPLHVGTLATGVDHPVEIAVTNTGRESIRLAGIDGEWC